MKRILKSLLVLTLVVATTTGATRAWFTSNVVAADNEIRTGTLRMGIRTVNEDATSTWWVIRDDGTQTGIIGSPLQRVTILLLASLLLGM